MGRLWRILSCYQMESRYHIVIVHVFSVKHGLGEARRHWAPCDSQNEAKENVFLSNFLVAD